MIKYKQRQFNITNEELKLPYKDYNWRMIKQNDE